VTKALYKDLLTVSKNASTGAIEVASRAYSVTGLAGEGVTRLFPHDSPHNACFVTVDPIARTAHVLYSAWVPFW
jgi:hypothetical protein